MLLVAISEISLQLTGNIKNLEIKTCSF